MIAVKLLFTLIIGLFFVGMNTALIPPPTGDKIPGWCMIAILNLFGIGALDLVWKAL